MNHKISLILITLYISNTHSMELPQDGQTDREERINNTEQKINKNYIELFPDLIDEICKSEPEDLLLNSSFQTMPNIFDTFCKMGLMTDQYPLLSDYWEDFFKTKESAYLMKYLELIAKVALSDFEEKNILLDKLIQKLGKNLGFLYMINNIIVETPTFESKLKQILEKHESLRGASRKLVNEALDSDMEFKILEKQINLVIKKINLFITIISHGNELDTDLAELRIESSDEEADDEEESSDTEESYYSISSTEVSSKEEE